MEISKYKQAMKYLLNDNAPLKTFVINPDARLVDNDPRPQTESLSLANGGRVGFDLGGLSKLKKIFPKPLPEMISLRESSDISSYISSLEKKLSKKFLKCSI